VATTRLPTPVLVAGGSLCLLAGYVLGVVAGPTSPDRSTGTVESYDPGSDQLCLSGEAVADTVAELGGAEGGRLCGTWRRTPGSTTPDTGDKFLFVSIRATDDPEDAEDPVRVLIYGDVVEQG
jgi:hypothetical protein